MVAQKDVIFLKVWLICSNCHPSSFALTFVLVWVVQRSMKWVCTCPNCWIKVEVSVDNSCEVWRAYGTYKWGLICWASLQKQACVFCNSRVSGNGTTGMAMAVPVFEGSKNGIAWILTYPCVMEWHLPAVCRSLGYLNYDEAFFRLFWVFKHTK